MFAGRIRSVFHRLPQLSPTAATPYRRTDPPGSLTGMDNLHRGVVSRRTLMATMSQTELQRLVRTGALRRLRRGWYAADGAHPAVVSAVSAGGVLGCVSALALHGVWVPTTDRVHVRAARSGGRFCRQHGRPEPERAAVDDLPTALRHAVRCLDDEGIVVVCDSLLHLKLLTHSELEFELRGATAHVRALLGRCDRAESGTETMVRLRLRRSGLRVTPQVWIDGLGRVDLLVGNRLILEIDGRQYHDGPDRFEADRQRDRRAIELGYVVIRVSYRQVIHDWPAVEAAIMQVVRRGDHCGALPKYRSARRKRVERG